MGRCIIYTRIRLLLLLLIFPLFLHFLFSNFQKLKFFVTLLSGTVRPRRLKLSTHVDSGWLYCVYQNQAAAAYSSLYYTSRKLCLWGGYTVFTLSIRLSVRPSVTFWFFFYILKRQLWKFIKFCRHIDINKMYVYNRKLRARGQFCWSYCPL